MRIKEILYLSVLILSGCSGDLVETKVKEINSGSYKLSGTEIKTVHAFPWGEENEILSSDTTEINFTVEVEYPKGRKDTVRFNDLRGAERAVVSCRDQRPGCVAYARLNGSKLVFDIDGLGGFYIGNGFLGAETLILETYFRYRGDWVYYHLHGEKLED